MIDKFMYKCNFCNKECFSIKSYRGHETRCKHNPNRINPASWSTSNRKGLPAWNSGLSGDIRCMTATEDSKKKMSIAATIKNKNETSDTREKRKATIAKKVAKNEWHTSLARHMHIDYNGTDLHGSWELAYAKYLDSNNIKWIRNIDSFVYNFEDKDRRYTPDFYLPIEDEYVEIKGYKTKKDDAKWTQFPKKLKILMHYDLKKLNIIP